MHRIVAALFFALTALPSADSLATSTDAPDQAMLPPDLWTQFAERITVHPFIALLGPIGFFCPFLVGLWAGPRRILENPARHRRLLTTTVVVGIGAAVLGAQPVSLVLARVIDRPSDDALSVFGPLHDAAGVLGGFGYAALIALLSIRFAPKPGPITLAIAATGQRSLTCYLAQSVVWTVAFAPYLLDLSGPLGVTTTALLAAATWLATVLLADRMRRTGYRGPFELLIRRVTYRSRPKLTARTT
ncbi:uncharacterized protein DUF418 [Kribbella sp. VKM Ac-2527]|uniref:Uncharacterized protein DUF418 n=1 Tax=Kribbella caucasensis TaxID=2512215 RepID=A0A4R6JD57_9ACTN|nr:DUF418 domain-containing protein [Kribbella sp. VKM Ac-2527]TDO33482.1 uncharacterized protein DUF418 [Kribbella sp. VKM Ac-2527]